MEDDYRKPVLGGNPLKGALGINREPERTGPRIEEPPKDPGKCWFCKKPISDPPEPNVQEYPSRGVGHTICALRDQLTAAERVTANSAGFYDDYVRISAELEKLGMFIRDHYGYEIATGKHGHFKSGVDCAIFYLSKERNRWSRLISRLFHRGFASGLYEEQDKLDKKKGG